MKFLPFFVDEYAAMKSAEIIRVTRPMVLYPPPARIREKIPIYTVPAQSKLSGAGKKAFIPNYPDSLFKNTQKIDKAWLIQRMKEIVSVNLHPQIQVIDIIDHCQKDYELAERFAGLANQRGKNIDLERLKTFVFAHDLGRTATAGKNPRFLEYLPTPYHGVVGREIFIHFSERFKAVGKHKLAKLCLSLAKMCSSHTAGVGFVADSNRALGISPHGKTSFEDDLVWGNPTEHLPERLLIGVSDAKYFYPNHSFQYNGAIRIYSNHQHLIEISDGQIVIDKLVKKIFIKSGKTLQTLIYREIADWKSKDIIVVELGEKRMVLMEDTSQTLTLYYTEEGKPKVLPLPGFELLSIGNGTVKVQECLVASREAVHKRFDHFRKNNKPNIDRAFEEVVTIVGEENRSLVDGGWFDPKRIPV